MSFHIELQTITWGYLGYEGARRSFGAGRMEREDAEFLGDRLFAAGRRRKDERTEIELAVGTFAIWASWGPKPQRQPDDAVRVAEVSLERLQSRAS